MKMFLYPGGHIDSNDINILQAAKREIKEETGLENLELLKIVENELVPFDIDTHKIGYNERLNLPEHYHFDFRYLFMIESISDIQADVLTARALAELETLLVLGKNIIKQNTVCLFLKGENVQQEIKKCTIPCQIKQIKSVTNSNSSILKITEVKYD
jgi:hypothetical protein